MARKGRRLRPIRFVTTNPFFAPALIRKASGGVGITINVVYDLYPDALLSAGTVRPNSQLAKSLASITRYSFNQCDATVFIGDRIRQRAESLYGTPRRSFIIPIGADGRPFRNSPPILGSDLNTVTVMYCGQMGRMHDIDTIASAIASGQFHALRFVFRASGAGYAELLRRVPSDARWEHGGALTTSEWQKAMLRAQIALVTMAEGAEDVALPSKAYSALVAGQAILAICPSNSDLADLIRKHDCGWVVSPRDIGNLERILKSVQSDRAEVQRKRINAFTAGHQYYDISIIAKEWLNIIRELDSQPSHRNG